ncbi:MAG: type II toxin-antitoxin system HicB family antitoxin [Nanoarchaeota archaeon]
MNIDIVIYPEGKGENKTYSISSMQIPNVVTQGDTIEEAKMRLKEALELYFESAPSEYERLIQIEKEEENNAPMISKLAINILKARSVPQ